MNYRRFLIPLNTANGTGGRCLVEKMQNIGTRITLALRTTVRKPLDLWLFDEEKAYRFPKTLYPDKTGSIVLRQDVRDMPLDTVTCACLLDESLQPIYEGGKKTDWRSIMLNIGKTAENVSDTAKDGENGIPEAEKPENTVTETAENASPSQNEDIKEDIKEEVKEEVKKLVSQLDEQLKPRQKAPLPNGLDWCETDLKQLAANKRLWKYARNPFVISHCREKGLLLAENEKFYYLGVPCEYSDRLNGCSQGFRIFGDKDGRSYCILKCEK